MAPQRYSVSTISDARFLPGNRFRVEAPEALTALTDLLNHILSLPTWQFVLLLERLDGYLDPDGDGR
jgi:hypothetical protein